MRRREPVTGVLRAAIDATRTTGKLPRRHPLTVTADRLVDHAIDPRIADRLDGPVRDAIGLVIHTFREITGEDTEDDGTAGP